MKVLVIGAGNMGSGFVKQLSAAGHSVSVTARDAAKAASLASQYANVKAVAAAGAAEGQDVVVLATGYGDAASALQSVGNLQGKVVVDITNPLTSDYMGLTLGHSTSAAEEIAKAVPGANVVKAFNTVLAQVLGQAPRWLTAARSPCSMPATTKPPRPLSRPWPRAWALPRSMPAA